MVGGSLAPIVCTASAVALDRHRFLSGLTVSRLTPRRSANSRRVTQRSDAAITPLLRFPGDSWGGD